MPKTPWNDDYAAGDLPWDTGQPDPRLVEFIESGAIVPGRALDVGCGTGTDAIWLAERGFDVLGIDLSPLAVDQARSKLGASKLRCRFAALDFLAAAPAEPPFDFVFDRGCFHGFDEAEERSRFARRVAAALTTGGLWLSLIRSTEGPARDKGSPCRSALDVISAIEPELEILELRSIPSQIESARAWFCLSRRRPDPEGPVTRSP
ncbi:class I SAM-dependent methyltransferase [Pendulispora brunnea]|uniref:Class I SAM-dependent methyltransferase n=1 Tax=Pendulispora brunnea TaxID=2905690 RepID=A0ABZ2K6E5_9BACT